MLRPFFFKFRQRDNALPTPCFASMAFIALTHASSVDHLPSGTFTLIKDQYWAMQLAEIFILDYPLTGKYEPSINISAPLHPSLLGLTAVLSQLAHGPAMMMT